MGYHQGVDGISAPIANKNQRAIPGRPDRVEWARGATKTKTEMPLYFDSEGGVALAECEHTERRWMS
jgi:hypothetical protein